MSNTIHIIRSEDWEALYINRRLFVQCSQITASHVASAVRSPAITFTVDNRWLLDQNQAAFPLALDEIPIEKLR